MNLNYVTGHGIARDILCKFFKSFYFSKCCSDLGRFLALQFGDYNIHNNIKLFAIFTTDLIFHGPIYSRKSSKLLPCVWGLDRATHTYIVGWLSSPPSSLREDLLARWVKYHQSCL